MSERYAKESITESEVQMIINRIKLIPSTPLYAGNRETFWLINEGFDLVRDDPDKIALHIDFIYFDSPKQIWLSRCSDLNDPFEGIKFILPESNFSQNGLPEEIKNRYNVKNTGELIDFLSSFRDKYCQTSFSSSYNDVQMWG